MNIQENKDLSMEKKESPQDTKNGLQRFWTMMEAAVEKKDIIQNLTPLGLSALQDVEVGEKE